MKLLIEEEIRISDGLEDLLKDCSVGFRIELDEIIIHPQKVTLEETDMNELFFWAFKNDFHIEYAWLGDSDCDFSLELTNKKD